MQSFISFYYDSTRKIIGWKVKGELSENQLKSKKYKLVKSNPRSAAYVTTIQGILEQVNGQLTKDKYKNLEVKKYVEKQGILDKGEVYYYVQLKDTYEDDEGDNN